MPWVIWITGLPGSGKSTLAIALKKKIPDAVILRMDELRKIVTPKPCYSDAEREYVYRALVFTAKNLYALGPNVIIDSTGNKKSWRLHARKLIKNFFEVYLKNKALKTQRLIHILQAKLISSALPVLLAQPS
ncbi:MAG: adenylyl-sulfate kinase [Nitrospirae bacterium]|nr:adenylyl-sulfate kinase [Nitrospirota bacterium]